MPVRDVFSSEGLTGEGSTSKLSQADDRIYFLVAVRFITAYFFKASIEDREVVCEEHGVLYIMGMGVTSSWPHSIM